MVAEATARRGSRLLLRAAFVAAGGALLLFVVVPIAGLVASTTPEEFVAGLRHPVVWPALRLSLITTTISVVVVVALGTPLAWMLARRPGRLTRAVETLIQLPVVIPPAVAGLALLLVFGRHGLLAGVLFPSGSSLAFTTAAVVLAEIFVSCPFFVQSATSGFRRVDNNLINVGRSLGASEARVFFRIALPLAGPALLAGAAMSWARALGEFGATLMFAGNLMGRTQTLPLAIYAAFESDMRAAKALSLVLVAVAFGLLLILRQGGSRARP